MPVLPALLLWTTVAAAAPGPCPDDAGFRGRVAAARAAPVPGESLDALALSLAACLGHPDPALRDGLAYESLAAWLRADALSAPARVALRERLLADLVAPDPDGFRRPFAAIVLAEVARTDRVSPWMAPADRDRLVQAAADYLAGVRDYRGFTDGEGWRHGVAHGADLAMQLALNPALDRAALDRLLDAIAVQVAPAGAPPYVHGEPERLARPVVFILARGLHGPADWQAWLARAAAPAPMADWSEAWRSEAGLARRHDLRAFLLALHAALGPDGAGLPDYLPAVSAALRATD